MSLQLLATGGKVNGSDLSAYRKQHRLSLTEMADLLDVSKRHLIRMEKDEVPIRDTAGDTLRYRDLLARMRSYTLDKPAFRFIDLFAGIGGFRMGFESIGGACVFTSEWNRFAQKTYLENFSVDHAIAGDITEVPTEAIPPHDVLLAGFPCQPFSIAGVSKKNALGRPHGFEDATQGTLFFDIARILDVHRPRAFVLENVKNLISHDRGKTFKVIKKVLTDDLGYHISFRVIDARHWVPQHRERIFIVGFSERVDFDIEQDIEFPKWDDPHMESILHPEDGSEVAESPYTEGSKAEVADKYTLSDRLWTYLQEYAEKHRRKGNGFGFGLVGPNDVSRTLSARYYKDGSEILVRREGGNPRRLTPRECARLMGFDSVRTRFRIPVSDTQAYKQFGNAVAVPVVKAVARAISPHLDSDARVAHAGQQELFAAR